MRNYWFTGPILPIWKKIFCTMLEELEFILRIAMKCITFCGTPPRFVNLHFKMEFCILHGCTVPGTSNGITDTPDNQSGIGIYSYTSANTLQKKLCGKFIQWYDIQLNKEYLQGGVLEMFVKQMPSLLAYR